MKKVTCLIAFLFMLQNASSQIISQYIETDSGSTPKGIEIWNNTSTTLDFTTSSLVVEKGVNGAAPAEDISITAGSLAANAVMIIGTIDLESMAIANNIIFIEKNFSFNGDDALVIKYGGIITDVFGDPGTGDPGSNWSGNGVSTQNQNIQLIAGITDGDLDGFIDPSTRFETVNTTPSDAGGLTGFGIAPQQASVQLSITEIFSGQQGADLTPDWFEIENTGTVAWDATTDGDLFYDDDSADATTADIVQGISSLAPGEIAIVLITDNSNDVTSFQNIWGQVIDLTNIQVGFTDGSGLGGGGDAVNLWIGDPALSSPAASGSYPDTSLNDAQSYDVELGAFSTIDNLNNAVQTIAAGGDNSDVPNIASPGNGNALIALNITEIFSGQAGTDLTADWFEVENIGTRAYDATVHGDLFYDDDSADATTADIVQGISDLAPGEIAIVLITDNSNDVTSFQNIWGQVIDLTNIQVGFTDGSGLGGGGDAVNLWIGDPTLSSPAASGSYPDTSLNDAQSYDVELAAFSTVGNLNGAVQTIAAGGDNGDVPNIASPGNGNVVSQIFVSFEQSHTSVLENAGMLNISVSLNQITTNDVNVNVDVIPGGNATNNVEFNFMAQNIVIPAGQLSNSISVTINNDNLDTQDKFFVLELDAATNSTIGNNSLHAVYLLDDDNQSPTSSSSVLDINLLTSYLVDSNGTAEITAFDPTSQRLYVVNNTTIEILDFTDPNNLSTISSIDVSPYGSAAQSVAVSNGLVAIAVAGATVTDNGSVLLMDAFGNNPQTVDVGVLPDMLTFTPDGSKILVANEGQPNDDYSIDPEGSVSIIDVTAGLGAITQSAVQTLDFNSFDSQLNNLLANGIRIFGPNATVSQDLEPEYITVSENGERAYVSLQENNAYAIVNLLTNQVESIFPYGLKDHNLPENSLDLNNDTDFIFDATWPVKGMYMPDGIASYEVAGITYIVTANEGDAREYSTYEEEVNLGDNGYNLDPTAFSNIDILQLPTNLAAINISNASGDVDGDGLFEEIHIYGGRSFSIFEAETGTLIYDSGNDFERIIASDPVYNSIFNTSNSNNSFKDRSDNKGVEPEGVIVQEINGAIYAFIILERVGGMMVYDITDPNAPQFIDYKNNRGTIQNGATSGDLGPEGILYIPADQNSLNLGLIVISNEVSATVSVYALNNDTLSMDQVTLPENELSVYPNPVRNILNLNTASNYQVYDMKGTLIESLTNVKSIDVSQLKAGIYLVKSETGTSTKFIKI